MRTDARKDGRQVYCPNASTIAYDTRFARVGHWMSYTYRKDDGTLISHEIGRMIGRIVYAPALGETSEIKGWIEVLTLHHDLTHASIRWVDPSWVVQVHPATPDIVQFLAWFAGPLPSADWLRGASEYGTLGANQCPDRPEWNFAGKRARYDEVHARVRANSNQKHYTENNR